MATAAVNKTVNVRITNLALYVCVCGYVRAYACVYMYACNWAVRESNPGRGEIFRTLPHRPCGPSSLLYNGYRFCFPWDKAARAWR